MAPAPCRPPARHPLARPQGRASSLPLLAPHPKSPPSPNLPPLSLPAAPGAGPLCSVGFFTGVPPREVFPGGMSVPPGPREVPRPPAGMHSSHPLLSTLFFKDERRPLRAWHVPTAPAAPSSLTLLDTSLGSPPQDTVLTAEPRATRPPQLGGVSGPRGTHLPHGRGTYTCVAREPPCPLGQRRLIPL